MSNKYLLRKGVVDEKLDQHIPDDFDKRLKKHDKLRRTLNVVAKMIKAVITDKDPCARIDSMIAEFDTDKWYDAMIQEIEKTYQSVDGYDSYYERIKAEEGIQKKYWRRLNESYKKWGI
jgi:ribosomal 50S subunit-associated protein YjgA (DUF615 family)